MYTRADPIIPWSERAEHSKAEQILVYKNIDFESDFESDFENDFEGDCEAVSNPSNDFEGFSIWKARLQKAESERRFFRKANLKGAPSEKRIWEARFQQSSINIKTSMFESAPAPFEMILTGALVWFEAILTDFNCFSRLFVCFRALCRKKSKRTTKSLSQKILFRLISMCLCVFYIAFLKEILKALSPPRPIAKY